MHEVASNYIPAETLEKAGKAGEVTVQLGCGLVAGAAAAVLSHPADTLLSKINKGDGGQTGSAMHKLMVCARSTGFSGLWAGLGTRTIMTMGLVSGQVSLEWRKEQACSLERCGQIEELRPSSETKADLEQHLPHLPSTFRPSSSVLPLHPLSLNLNNFSSTSSAISVLSSLLFSPPQFLLYAQIKQALAAPPGIEIAKDVEKTDWEVHLFSLSRVNQVASQKGTSLPVNTKTHRSGGSLVIAYFLLLWHELHCLLLGYCFQWSLSKSEACSLEMAGRGRGGTSSNRFKQVIDDASTDPLFLRFELELSFLFLNIHPHPSKLQYDSRIFRIHFTQRQKHSRNVF